MKPYVLVLILLSAVLDGLLLVPALHAFVPALGAGALCLTLVAIAVALMERRPAAVAAPVVAAAPLPPAPAANQAEAEIVAFVGLLQEKGRLVDFLMDDVTPCDDAQVGAAARVVHQGCQSVLREHFQIAPVSAAEEGTKVTVPTGADAEDYRLIGKLSGEAPFTGTLTHKGWKAVSVKLPRILPSAAGRLPAIAPAEVEIR